MKTYPQLKKKKLKYCTSAARIHLLHVHGVTNFCAFVTITSPIRNATILSHYSDVFESISTVCKALLWVIQYSVWLRAGRPGDPRQRRKDFSSSLCVQTGSGAHPASCTTGSGVLSPGLKHGQGVTLATRSHPVPRSWMSRSYTSSPPKRLRGV